MYMSALKVRTYIQVEIIDTNKCRIQMLLSTVDTNKHYAVEILNFLFATKYSE